QQLRLLVAKLLLALQELSPERLLRRDLLIELLADSIICNRDLTTCQLKTITMLQSEVVQLVFRIDPCLFRRQELSAPGGLSRNALIETVQHALLRCRR